MNNTKPSESTAADHQEKADQSNQKRKDRVNKKNREKRVYNKEVVDCWNEAHKINETMNEAIKTPKKEKKKVSKKGGISIEVAGKEYKNLSEFVYSLEGCENRKEDYSYALSIWTKINRNLKKKGSYILNHQKESFEINLIIS